MNRFLKVFEGETALGLIGRGFTFMEEKINADQKVYVFEATPELLKVLGECYGLEKAVYGDTLCFGGGGTA